MPSFSSVPGLPRVSTWRADLSMMGFLTGTATRTSNTHSVSHCTTSRPCCLPRAGASCPPAAPGSQPRWVELTFILFPRGNEVCFNQKCFIHPPHVSGLREVGLRDQAWTSDSVMVVRQWECRGASLRTPGRISSLFRSIRYWLSINMKIFVMGYNTSNTF